MARKTERMGVNRSAMRGQALTELAVMSALLVPLFLLIPIVAKYGHAKQMAQQAARNAAWEATATKDYVLKSRSQLQAKAIERNFAAADAKISSNIAGGATGEFGDQMLNTFSGRKLLERSDLKVTRYDEASAPGIVTSMIAKFPEALPGEFPPNKAGYVTAEVELKLRDLKTSNGAPADYLSPMDNLGLVMKQHQTLLADAWNAAGPRQGKRSVASQVKSLTPTSNLEPLSKMLDFIGAAPLPILGQVDKLDIGTIEPDVVPSDKLARYPVRGP